MNITFKLDEIPSNFNDRPVKNLNPSKMPNFKDFLSKIEVYLK